VDFDALLDQAITLLQRRGRLTYGALKRQFQLDDEYLADLTAELIDGQRVAVDEGGKVLVWTGAGAPASALPSNPPQLQSPATYTPPHLAERIRAEQAAMEARGTVDGERKVITALFADLKGSTALIEGLDPEEARSIIDPALQVMMDAVHRYDGYVAQALGDGIFALFGAPLAHEDHPQRALYAALRMQEEMRQYSDQVRLKHGVPLAMRVGVNTGEVVVRSIHKDDLHTDYVPVGHSTNLAARMEQLATPGSILITAYTHKLTEGYFAFKALGAAEIKGVEEPLPIYEVLGAGLLRTRLQVTATRRGLTRFVGRQSELEQLYKALDQAKAGQGQIVGVMGEPGVGKSRLFYEFKLLLQCSCLVLEAYSVSHGKASPYLPVLELLKQYFDISAEDDERKRREKIGGKVFMLDRRLEDTLPYLLTLLGVEEQPSPLLQMDPQIRRRRTFDAIKKLFIRESLNQPLLLIFEDLHWIDSETQGFLDTFSESVASARMLLLTNYRPEYRHEWGQKTYYTQLRLTPLGHAEAAELLTYLLGTDPSLKPLTPIILEKTEGTPFFMEEVVQTLAEEGVLAGARGHYWLERAPAVLHLSPTVQGVLAARIDRLSGDEKALLQQLAVIGRDFPLSLVRQVVPQAEEEVYRVLASLQRKEFLYEQLAFPDVEYSFKHALTQEVAYGTVLQERRKALHERTAQALERLYHDRLDEHYSDLAHHYTRSGNTPKAVDYLQHAGHQAAQRLAHADAIRYLTSALDLLLSFPDTTERARKELSLQITLGTLHQATKGFQAAEAEAAYTRARELCQRVEEPLQLFSVLFGLGNVYLGRGAYQTALVLGEQLLILAQQVQDPARLLGAHQMLGFSLSSLGEYVSAKEHFEHGVSLYSPSYASTLLSLYGFDAGVACLSGLGIALWVLGYPEQALRKSQNALKSARELAHPFSLAWALDGLSIQYQFRGEGRVAQEHAETLMSLAEKHGFPLWSAWGTGDRGWALAEQGRIEEGITHLLQSRAAFQVMEMAFGQSYLLALLAEAYGKGGQIDAGLHVLAEATVAMRNTGQRNCEAELYRLKGMLTLQQESQKSKGKGQKSKISNTQHPTSNTQAEACFLTAIDIARQQQAKSPELRATVSLARLWQSQGKQQAARAMLSEIYGWFTEGFDTKDLKEAKALLEELH
jgi:class 3 adenylate cyclase/tetratricopeptide (TPR) repeat protein